MGSVISKFRDTPYLRGFIFVGQMYSATWTFSITAGATQWIQFTTPADKLVHGVNRRLTPNIGDCYMRLHEGVTITTPGSGAIPARNLNRNSAKTASAAYLRSPVVTGGTIIEEVYMPGDTGGIFSPDSSYPVFEGVEREYKVDTEYAVELFNDTAETLTIQYSFIWYESGN